MATSAKQEQKTIRLAKGGERRALAGHLWIFSNELHLSDAPLEAGDDVVVEDWRGRLVGSGLYSGSSLIAVRLHAPGRRAPFDTGHVRGALLRALELRSRLLAGEAANCRLVFGEADNLPGLIADRYGDYLSVQLLTQGTQRRAPLILDSLEELLRPAGIILRNDSPSRVLEGLERQVTIARGQVPEKVRFTYQGFKLCADLGGGQKTGFFFDQRENYRLIHPVSEGAKVLDAFCYSGAWGQNALRHGAAAVDFLDISADALLLARENVCANGLEQRADLIEADALEYLKGRPGPYGLVILDPPAFVKSRRKIEEARKGYMNLNKWGMRAVERGGYLLTCSCSHHIGPEDFVELLALAAREAGVFARVVATGRQGPDHPWIPAMPETHYLKVLLLQIS